MRSMRALMLLAITAVAASALVAPAIASANWQSGGIELTGISGWSENGEPLESEASLDLSGTMSWSGELGTMSCSVDLAVTLSPGTGGQVNSFSADQCEAGGLLGTICGPKVGEVSSTAPWSVVATTQGSQRVMQIEDTSVTYEVCGGENKVVAAGTLLATPDDSAAIDSVSLSGTSNVSVDQQSMGTVTYGGSLDASPSGEYGITDKRAVDISGSLGWNGEAGSMSCPVSGKMALEPGTQGQVTSLNWDAANCTLGGVIGSTCGGVTSVTSNSLPWTIVDQGSSIRITEFPLTIDFSGACGDWSVSGEMTATPNNASAISSSSLSGSLYTGDSIKAWSGSLDWSPAGVYGL